MFGGGRRGIGDVARAGGHAHTRGEGGGGRSRRGQRVVIRMTGVGVPP